MRKLQRFAAAEQRVDWWRVITDLERAQWSHERLAAECLRSKGWVDGVKNGQSEPRFHDGLILLKIWSDVTGKCCLEYPAEGKRQPVGIAAG